MLTRYLLWPCFRPPVCLSVCHRQSFTKMVNIWSCKQLSDSSFLVLKIMTKFQRVHPNRYAKYRLGRLKSAIFDQYLVISRCAGKTWNCYRALSGLYTSLSIVSINVDNGASRGLVCDRWVFLLTLLIFLSLHFTARRYASAVYAVIVCLSVRLSVCHTPVLYQNG